jgi:hypothetical protein
MEYVKMLSNVKLQLEIIKIDHSEYINDNSLLIVNALRYFKEDFEVYLRAVEVPKYRHKSKDYYFYNAILTMDITKYSDINVPKLDVNIIKRAKNKGVIVNNDYDNVEILEDNDLNKIKWQMGTNKNFFNLRYQVTITDIRMIKFFRNKIINFYIINTTSKVIILGYDIELKWILELTSKNFHVVVDHMKSLNNYRLKNK